MNRGNLIKMLSIDEEKMKNFEESIQLTKEKFEAQEKLILDLQCKADLHEKNAAQKNDDLSSKIDDVNVKMQDKISVLEFRFNDISPVILNINLDIEKQKKEIENINNIIVNIYTTLDVLSKKQDLCCSVDDLSVVQAEFRLFTSKNQEYLQQLEEKIKSNEDKCLLSFVEISREIAKIQENVNQSVLEEKKIHTLIDLCNSEIVITKALNKALHEDLSDGLTKMMDDKINAIPKPVIPTLDEAKDAMRQQLEPVCLDAKNANMRSTNTDVKVHILEKKLEQLKLMVEQINLQA